MKNHKLILHPREFNRLVEVGFIESQYIINPEIDHEKDDLYKRITELEFQNKLKDSLILVFMDNWNYLRDVLSNYNSYGNLFDDCDDLEYENAKKFSEDFALNVFREIYERINKEREISCLNEYEAFKEFFFEERKLGEKARQTLAKIKGGE